MRGERPVKGLSTTLTLFILICILNACGIVKEETAPLPTVFKTSFSLGSTVEANEQHLLPGARALSGSEAGPVKPFIQEYEVMTVQVESANEFAFMEAIRSDIEKALASSDAEIVGRGGAIRQAPEGDLFEMTHFSLSYREGAMYGVISVWGVQGEGTDFNLIVQITESSDA